MNKNETPIFEYEGQQYILNDTGIYHIQKHIKSWIDVGNVTEL